MPPKGPNPYYLKQAAMRNIFGHIGYLIVQVYPDTPHWAEAIANAKKAVDLCIKVGKAYTRDEINLALNYADAAAKWVLDQKPGDFFEEDQQWQKWTEIFRS